MWVNVGQVKVESSVNKKRANLAGNWILDMSKSDLGSLKPDLLYDSLTLLISYQEPKITITRKLIKNKHGRVQQLVYYTDERGEKNPTFTGKRTIESKTKWDGTLLLVKGIMLAPTGGDIITQETTEKWEISADGTMLVQVISAGHFRSKFGKTVFKYDGAETIKRVFTKVG